MPKHLTCDKCGSPDGATEDYDGRVLCERHRIESDLYHARIEYKQKREWVKSVWLSQLWLMRENIVKLEKELEQKG